MRAGCLLLAHLFSPTIARAALATPPGPYDYETVEISTGVYGFFETKLNPIVSSNVIAVIGKQGVLIFDAGHHPPITRQIATDLRRLTDRPVMYVVVSHWHDDHWVGNAELTDAWPGAEVIAHPFTSIGWSPGRSASTSAAARSSSSSSAGATRPAT